MSSDEDHECVFPEEKDGNWTTVALRCAICESIPTSEWVMNRLLGDKT